MDKKVTGRDLLDNGVRQGKWFKDALNAANAIIEHGGSFDEAIHAAKSHEPPPALELRKVGEVGFYSNIDSAVPEDQENIDAVMRTMTEIMRTPVVRAGAVMPDACPAGPLGTIPVGGVVASDGIHPGMHSADICCSMTISVFNGVSPKNLLDAVHSVTHFGPGGRPRGNQFRPSSELMKRFEGNSLLSDLQGYAIEHMATQGDGNHFAYVGTIKSTGETALVTHHGSRAPGAKLYAKGMKIAERYRQEISPETLKQNAWIPADTFDGDNYWEAMQIIRAWTKENHELIHNMAAEVVGQKVKGRFWNEHNFVFRKSDGLFYHAKGATPAFDGYADDASGLTLVPLNMAQPVLITRGRNAERGLGFSPHGAGRNFSRTKHKKMFEGMSDIDIFAIETKGIDARFFSGEIDISELPSAYKSADVVRAQIEKYKLAEVVDEVMPFGVVMAGDFQKAYWKK